MSRIQVRVATPADAPLILEMLHEAENWLRERGDPMWEAADLDPARLGRDVAAGMHRIAEVDGEPAGTIRFQLEDEEFWPDLLGSGEDAYVHRLAVRRSFARRGVGGALLDWAARHAAALGRRQLRLDCDHHRQRLRAFYERSGFRYQDERTVGPFRVARYVRTLS